MDVLAKISLHPAFRENALESGITEARLNEYEALASERLLIGLAPGTPEAARRIKELNPQIIEFYAEIEEKDQLQRTADNFLHSRQNLKQALALGMTPDEFEEMALIVKLMFAADWESVPVEHKERLGTLFAKLDLWAGQIVEPRIHNKGPKPGG